MKHTHSPSRLEAMELVIADWNSVYNAMSTKVKMQRLIELMDNPDKRVEVQQYLISLGLFLKSQGDEHRGEILATASHVISAFGVSCKMNDEGRLNDSNMWKPPAPPVSDNN